MSDSPYCVLCPDRERIPYRSPVCESCRAWLVSMLGDLGELAVELVADPDPVPDQRIPPTLRRGDWPELDRNTHGRDPVAADLPSGMVRHPGDLPINVDAVDISAPSRQAARALFVRGVLGVDPDQIGHLPLATTLDTAVRQWRDAGAPGDVLPTARVGDMLQWLAVRVDWACDWYEQISDFAAEIRSYRSTIRGILGLVDVPSYKTGIACPRCRNRSLYQRYGGPRDGNLWIECAECPAILSPLEYEAHVAVLRDAAIATTVRMLAMSLVRKDSVGPAR